MPEDGISRRELGTIMAAGLSMSGPASATGSLPRRLLGKTGFSVSLLGLGTAP